MLSRFVRAQDGLVTVEWVALAGAVVIGGITVVWLVMNNLKTPANAVGSNLTTCETYAASHSGSTSGCQ
jgi:Flp pilus assembly pilin Flp